MGGSCELDERGLTFTGSGRIHGIDVDLSEVGELTPGIAAVAALADSESVLRGVGHLRLHETDRLAALTKEINGLGGDVTETEDGLRIRPRPLHGGVFHTYDDHRLATAGAVLGLAVDGRAGREHRDDRQDPARTSPDVDRDARRPDAPAADRERVEREPEGVPRCAATASTPTRTTSGSAPTARAPARARTSAPSTRTRPRAWS